jgi:hypothetical protein
MRPTNHDQAPGDPTRTARHDTVGASHHLRRRRSTRRPPRKPSQSAPDAQRGRARRCSSAHAQTSCEDQGIVRISDRSDEVSAIRTSQFMMSACRTRWTCSSHGVLCSNDWWGGSLRIHAWAASRTAGVIPRATTGPFHRSRNPLPGSPDEQWLRSRQADLLPERLDRGGGDRQLINRHAPAGNLGGMVLRRQGP